MTTLLSCKEIAAAYGGQRLFSGVNLHVHSGDTIGIIGPNGSGKSTLLKIICGLADQDQGEILLAKHLRLGYLPQQTFFEGDISIVDCLFESLEKTSLEDSEKHVRVNAILSRALFADVNAKVASLSGGWQKRLSLCRALLARPDVLVMDEPTNHLDIEGILWLEKMLQLADGPAAYLLVSHDRRFLENATSRIVELAAVYPEGTFQVEGSYSDFLGKRQQFLDGQQAEEARLANRSRTEIEWLRRGPKARTSKARYRINEAHQLSDDLAEIKARNRSQNEISLDFTSTGRKTKKLLEAKGLARSMEGRVLFAGLDLVLGPKSRLGLLGANGCGKTSLMKILAGATGETQDLPDEGTIRLADGVKIVYFDQKRAGIDQSQSLRRALAPEGDSIVFRDRSVHVASWAKRFLFRHDQLETPVSQLSGGEQARILLAELIRQPADILLLDEPTNDLDIASLDVLENSLQEFAGALVLVSHDRFLLDRLCDQILGFTGDGGLGYYADYRQWLADRKDPAPKKQSKEKKEPVSQKKKNSAKLSYLDQREYDQLEPKIEAVEGEITRLKERLAAPDLQKDASGLAACWAELEEAEAAVEKLYSRWEELEEKKEG